MPAPVHIVTVELSVPEMYVLLGYAWLHAATTTGTVCSAHMRTAQALKVALREAGEPSQAIEEKLAQCLVELGVPLSS